MTVETAGETNPEETFNLKLITTAQDDMEEMLQTTND
jgi:hypothetical protein